MTLLLVVLAGFTLLSLGVLVGYTVGRQDGAEETYREVERYYRQR